MLFVVNGTPTAMVMHKAAGLASCVRRVLALDRRGCNHLSDGRQQLQCRERALSKGLFVQLPLLSHPLSRFPLMYGFQLGSVGTEDYSAATEMFELRWTESLSQQISHMILATEMISLLENPSMVDSKSMVTMLWNMVETLYSCSNLGPNTSLMQDCIRTDKTSTKLPA